MDSTQVTSPGPTSSLPSPHQPWSPIICSHHHVLTSPGPRSSIVPWQAVIKEGEGFGEWALIRNLSRAHTIYCASDECEVVSILGRDFLQVRAT
jgi:CRP-like cAMP-binding protein